MPSASLGCAEGVKGVLETVLGQELVAYRMAVERIGRTAGATAADDDVLVCACCCFVGWPCVLEGVELFVSFPSPLAHFCLSVSFLCYFSH